MLENNEIVPVEVYCGNSWEAEMVKNILEDNGVDAFLKDEYTGTLAPWYTSSGGFGSVKVVVSSVDYEKAMLIVREFEKNIKD